jgi:hypothetical protein
MRQERLDRPGERHGARPADSSPGSSQAGAVGAVPIEDRRDWCHDGPVDKWCDWNGPGGFMGHTCEPSDPYLAWIVREIRRDKMRAAVETGGVR